MNDNDQEPEHAIVFDTLLVTAGDDEEVLASLKEAVALADTHGDLDRGMIARLRLIRKATFSGNHEDVLVHFAWCLAQCQKNPGDNELLKRFGSEVRWCFKWVIASLPKFHTVTRAQIARAFDDMTELYDISGESHRAIHSLRGQTACIFGDLGQIEGHRDAWLAAPEDGSEDCAACEAHTLVTLNLALGRPADAVNAAAGLIKGRLRCAEQPATTDSDLLVPLFKLDRADEAQRLQQRSYRAIRRSRDYLKETGGFLAFLAATDQLSRGVEMLQTGIKYFIQVRRGWDRMHMLAGARLLLRRLLQVDRREVKLRLLPEFELYRRDNRYAVEPLLAWADGQFDDLAGQFDKRNGNTVISNGLRGMARLLETVRPIAKDEATGGE